MEQAVLSPLVVWESFYVIIGSSAAALTGLQFVVMTLSAGMNARAGETVTNASGPPQLAWFAPVGGYQVLSTQRNRPRSARGQT